MRPRPTRILLALALALAGVLSLSAVAHAAAGIVTVYDGGTYKTINYEGTSDANQVTFGGDVAAGSVTITETGIADPGAGADPGDICKLTSADTLTCTDPELGGLTLYAGNAQMAGGNDVTTGTGTQVWQVYGDEGEDSLTGSDLSEDWIDGGEHNDTIDGRGDGGRQYFAEQLYGGAGNDVIRGGSGRDNVDGGIGGDDLDGGADSDWIYGDGGVDSLRGGEGDDGLIPGDGDGEAAEGGGGSDWFACEGDPNETYDGGPGFDSVNCEGGVYVGTIFEADDYVIDLAAGTVRRINHGETLSTLSSVEDAETWEGNDVLLGTDGTNSLNSGDGADTVDGRGGSDYFWTYGGNDTIEAVDGAPDRVDAGSGDDTCRADALDEQTGCEGLSVAPAPSGSVADRTAPACAITGPRAKRAQGRIVFRVTCDESASVGVEATGRLRRLTRGALASRVGDVTLGTASARVAAGASVRVTVRVSRRFRRALPRRGRIRLALSALDAVGNHSEVARTVRVR